MELKQSTQTKAWEACWNAMVLDWIIIQSISTWPTNSLVHGGMVNSSDLSFGIGKLITITKVNRDKQSLGRSAYLEVRERKKNRKLFLTAGAHDFYCFWTAVLSNLTWNGVERSLILAARSRLMVLHILWKWCYFLEKLLQNSLVLIA